MWACLTPNRGQHFDVGPVEQGQGVLVNVQMRQMRDEIVPHQETHQDPVVYDPLQIVLERDLLLGERESERVRESFCEGSTGVTKKKSNLSSLSERRTRSQCILSSGTGAAGEMWSPPVPLSYK